MFSVSQRVAWGVASSGAATRMIWNTTACRNQQCRSDDTFKTIAEATFNFYIHHSGGYLAEQLRSVYSLARTGSDFSPFCLLRARFEDPKVPGSCSCFSGGASRASVLASFVAARSFVDVCRSIEIVDESCQSSSAAIYCATNTADLFQQRCRLCISTETSCLRGVVCSSQL